VKRAELVEKNHPKLSVREQCKILSVTRSTLNYQPVEESVEDLRIARIMDEIFLEDPCMGSRRLVTLLERDHGILANRKRIMRLRREMGIETIWCKPKRTSIPDNGHRKYPYLLEDRIVEVADEVWCADITYVPMPHACHALKHPGAGRQRWRGKHNSQNMVSFRHKQNCKTGLLLFR
jgi:hypothetical protein